MADWSHRKIGQSHAVPVLCSVPVRRRSRLRTPFLDRSRCIDLRRLPHVTDPVAINRHYGGTGLLETVKAALSANGLGFGTIHWSDLVAFDQFHTGGIEATKELATRLQIEPGMSVLDVGSGLGGPTRFLASSFDCQVTGLDLNPE